MDFEVDFSGFEELEEKFKELEKKASELDGSNEVPLTELFPKEFMETYTDFGSIEDFLEESNFGIESKDDFDDISDEFVETNTRFNSTEDMLKKGLGQWTKKQMDL